MATKQKKKKALQVHLDNECSCSGINSKDKDCIYQQFIDGWDFTPDVGRGQSSGEVFTPRFIVDKMITVSGMFPESIVYNNNFTNIDEKELKTIINNTICEPAVGTGNFISTILYYKLQVSKELYTKYNIPLKESILRSVETLYTYDIDAGNLETTFRRLTDGNTSGIDSDNVNSYWVNHVESLIGEEADHESIFNTISSSLTEAKENWSAHLADRGILKSFIEENSENISVDTDKLFNDCKNILRENIKLFDGITEESSSTIPGFVSIWWSMWDHGKLVEKKSLFNAIVLSKIEQLEKTNAALENEYLIDSKWSDKNKKKEFTKNNRELVKLRDSLIVE